MNSIMKYGNKTNLLQGSEIFTQKCVMFIEIIEIEIYFKNFKILLKFSLILTIVNIFLYLYILYILIYHMYMIVFKCTSIILFIFTILINFGMEIVSITTFQFV